MNAQQLGALALVYLGIRIIFGSIASIANWISFFAPTWALDGFVVRFGSAVLLLTGLGILIFSLIPAIWLVIKSRGLAARWFSVAEGTLSLDISAGQALAICLVLLGVGALVDGLANLGGSLPYFLMSWGLDENSRAMTTGAMLKGSFDGTCRLIVGILLIRWSPRLASRWAPGEA